MMLNQLLCWGRKIGLRNKGLLGAAIAGACLSYVPNALALSEAEVLEKLEKVPTFTIINKQGNLIPLQFIPEDNASQQENPLPWFFINPEAAIATLDSLKRKNPDFKDKIQVFPVQMSRVYELMKSTSTEDEEQPSLVLMPILQEVQSAWELLKADGQNIEQPEQVGIPLFFARIGEDNRFMTLQNDNNDPYIPFYWQKEQVQADIELYQKQAESASAEQIKIQVIPLHRFIAFLFENDDPATKLMQIIPSSQQIQTANRLLKEAPASLPTNGDDQQSAPQPSAPQPSAPSGAPNRESNPSQ